MNNKKLKIYIKMGLFSLVATFIVLGGMYYILFDNIDKIINLSNTELIFVFAISSITPFLFTLLYGFILLSKEKIINIKGFFNNFNIKVVFIGITLILLLGLIFNTIFGNKDSYSIFKEFQSGYSFYGIIILSLFVITMAILEEFYFRGILFDFLKIIIDKYIKNKTKGIIIVILITAMLFAIAHGIQYGIILLLQVFLIGIILGYIRYKFGLINTIAIHMMNNFIIIGITIFINGFGFVNDTIKIEYQRENNAIIRYIAHKQNLNPFIVKNYKQLEKIQNKNLSKEEIYNLIKFCNNKEAEYKKYLNNLDLNKEDKKNIISFLILNEANKKYLINKLNN